MRSSTIRTPRTKSAAPRKAPIDLRLCYAAAAPAVPRRIAERHDTLQQVRIADADMLRRRREFLALGDFRIGIGFEEIRRAVRREAEIDARIAVQFQRPIDPLCHVLDARRQLRRKILGRTVTDAAPFLIIGIVFDLLGGDVPIAVRHILKSQFPYRQRQKPFIADDADIDFAAFDILLDDGGGADALVDEIDALGEFLVGVDDGGLRDAVGRVLVDALDDERQCQPRRTLDLAVHRKHGKVRHRNAVIMHQRLRQILAARQHQPARIAAGIRHVHQFEIADDILIVDRLAAKLFKQREHDVGLPGVDLFADRLELVVNAERTDIVTGGAQRRDDVILRLPDVDFLLGVALARFRRDQIRMHEHQDAKLLHSAIHLRRDGPRSACMVFAVNKTVNSVSSFRSVPTARKLSSRHRWIMSSRTTSNVS